MAQAINAYVEYNVAIFVVVAEWPLSQTRANIYQSSFYLKVWQAGPSFSDPRIILSLFCCSSKGNGFSATTKNICLGLLPLLAFSNHLFQFGVIQLPKFVAVYSCHTFGGLTSVAQQLIFRNKMSRSSKEQSSIGACQSILIYIILQHRNLL